MKPILYTHNIAINCNQNINYYNRNKQQKSIQNPEFKTKPIFAYNISNIHFGTKNINELYQEYDNNIREKHLPAVNAFLAVDADKKDMDNFLTAILNTDDRSVEFIESLVRKPRDIIPLSEKIINKVGTDTKNLTPFLIGSTYNNAYKKFIDKKYSEAHTIQELLKIRPDWKGNVLIEKYKQLKGNEPFEIGHIPKEFPDNHIFVIADYLKDKMDISLKQNKEIPNLKLNNREYQFKFFTDGRSDKNVFGIITPERKKYVLKMADEKYRSLDNPYSLGTLAKIDSYLTTNRSRNSAPLCYYNHDKIFSIYKYIEHNKIEKKPNSLEEISQHLPDFKELGLSYNDNVGYNNYFELKMNSNEDIKDTEGFMDGIKKQEWISVDNDHVTYNMKFHPYISKYNAPLPNAMGMNFN